MHRALKTLSLWLIIASLPLQGLAAVIKSACGPAHHQPLSSVTVTDPHAHYGVQGGVGEHHGAIDHNHIAAAVAGDDAGAAASSDDATHASSYCAACAACCFGAVAPPSAMLPTPQPMASESIVFSPVSLLVGHVPSTPERPPRFAA